MIPPAPTTLCYLASRIRNIDSDVNLRRDLESARRELIILEKEWDEGRFPDHYSELIEFAREIIKTNGGITA